MVQYMSRTRIIPSIFYKDGKAINDQTGAVISDDVEKLAVHYANKGADALLFFDRSEGDYGHDRAIKTLQLICNDVEIPVIGGGNVARQEDVKKILYAGAKKAILNGSRAQIGKLLEEVSERFGKDRIAVSVREFDTLFKFSSQIAAWSSELILMHRPQFDSVDMISGIPSCILIMDQTEKEAVFTAMENEKLTGISGEFVSDPDLDIYSFKKECALRGMDMQVFKSAVSFSEFKTDERGLIPVVTQDYRSGEVLMLAYMNEESFRETLETGKMVYFSRSRQKLWMKGETSGHYQYVKSMSVDCDKDTLLAKVAQIGPACHTGHPTCFYTQLFGSDLDDKNPLLVFESVMDTILDRKKNPKEGSYTNYLFDKGIDKILKKVGEEASEVIIASKNPDSEDIRYEISDLLYHLMVLMAERGLSWEDVTSELSRR